MAALVARYFIAVRDSDDGAGAARGGCTGACCLADLDGAQDVPGVGDNAVYGFRSSNHSLVVTSAHTW